jgi:phospholipid/cholesterol/gamma-HCH transport system permease protein
MRALAALGAPWLLLFRTARSVRGAGLSFRACLAQVYELGSRSFWLIGSGLGFFGAVMVTIANGEARRFTGNLTVVGPSYFTLLVREFAPILAGLLAAARTGAGTSAELSWMTVGEQLEALEMSAADPLAELVAPRVVGGLIALPLLCVVGTACASISAMATAFVAYSADGTAFIDPRFLVRSDVVCALLKALAFGLYIPLAAAWRGISARGGASAVGRATTDGVVTACFGVLLIDLLIDQAFWLVRP